jgi:hypothetical protein
MHAPLSPAFRSEWCSVAALGPIAAEWRALAARALEPNVFYEPAFTLAAAPVFGTTLAPCWCGPPVAGSRACSPRASAAGAAASLRCWSAGRTPMRRSAHR